MRSGQISLRGGAGYNGHHQVRPAFDLALCDQFRGGQAAQGLEGGVLCREVLEPERGVKLDHVGAAAEDDMGAGGLPLQVVRIQAVPTANGGHGRQPDGTIRMNTAVLGRGREVRKQRCHERLLERSGPMNICVYVGPSDKREVYESVILASAKFLGRGGDQFLRETLLWMSILFESG